MAKYGYFPVLGGREVAIFEGDQMEQDKQFVKIYKNDPKGTQKLVAAIHLDKGQYIKEIED